MPCAFRAERLFRSSDGGGTWTPTNIEPDIGVVGDLITVDNLIFAATMKGDNLSTDDGLSWQRVNQWDPISYLYVIFKNSLVNNGLDGLFVTPRLGESLLDFDKRKVSPLSRRKGGIGSPKYLVTTGDAIFAGDNDHLLRSRDLETWEAAEGAIRHAVWKERLMSVKRLPCKWQSGRRKGIAARLQCCKRKGGRYVRRNHYHALPAQAH